MALKIIGNTLYAEISVEEAKIKGEELEEMIEEYNKDIEEMKKEKEQIDEFLKVVDLPEEKVEAEQIKGKFY